MNKMRNRRSAFLVHRGIMHKGAEENKGIEVERLM